MVLRFAPAEILGMAVELEKKGIDFYRRLQESAHQEVKKIFAFLAEEEKKHLAFFNDLLSTLETEEAFQDNEEVTQYLGSIVESGILGKVLAGQVGSSSLTDALETGIEVEKESVLFYQGFMPLVNPAKRGWLEKVIEEEKRHFLQLVALRKEMG
ncbi:MAG: ferritin family protein [Candidatus Atribacteria bacterium]|nr:ferritin family protein [Candidatus Atribacteria bacterium]